MRSSMGVGSAFECVGDLGERVRDDVPGLGCVDVRGLAWSVLVRSSDEDGAQADGACCREVGGARWGSGS